MTPLLLAAALTASPPRLQLRPILQAVPDRRALEAEYGLDVVMIENGTYAAVINPAAEPIGLDSLPFNLGPALPHRRTPAGYSDLAGIEARMARIASEHPDRATVVDLMARFSAGKTIEGRSVSALKLGSNVHSEEDKPNVLIISAHHSREIVTPEVVMGIADLLLDTSRSSRSLLDRASYWLIPVLNVDGYHFCFAHEPLWRKNRRHLPSGAVGVDLNRNYPFGWDTGCGGSTEPTSETYRGPSPLSEAESTLITIISKELKFERVMDFHSSGREVLHGFVCTEMPEPLDQWLEADAVALSKKADYVIRRPSGEGQHQIYQNAYNTLSAFLVETMTEFQPSYQVALAEVRRVMPLVQMFLEAPTPIQGHVRDKATGAPLGARVLRLDFEHELVDGQRRDTDPASGRFHLWLPEGHYTVGFEAEGYTRREMRVHVVDGQTLDLEVELERATGHGAA